MNQISDSLARGFDSVKQALTSTTVKHLIAGGVAGAVSRTVVSPLERMKILFQASYLVVRKAYADSASLNTCLAVVGLLGVEGVVPSCVCVLSQA